MGSTWMARVPRRGNPDAIEWAKCRGVNTKVHGRVQWATAGHWRDMRGEHAILERRLAMLPNGAPIARSTRLFRTMDRCTDVRSLTYVPSIKPLKFHRDSDVRPGAIRLILGLYEAHNNAGLVFALLEHERCEETADHPRCAAGHEGNGGKGLALASVAFQGKFAQICHKGGKFNKGGKLGKLVVKLQYTFFPLPPGHPWLGPGGAQPSIAERCYRCGLFVFEEGGL